MLNRKKGGKSMPADLHEMLRPALMNNTFDYKSMEDALWKTYYNSYNYLYKRQVSEINYNEFFYYTNDIDSRKHNESGRFYLNKSLKAVFEIDYDIIGNVNREEYRRSRFYQKEFTFMDMIYNPQIFSQIPILLIDNSLIYDYFISVSEDYTRFRLPFKRSFVLKNPRNPINDHVIYQNHRVQVITVDNSFYQRFLYNKSTLLYDDVRKTITLGKSKIEEDTRNNIIYDTNKYYLKKYKASSIDELTEIQKNVVNTEIARRTKNLKFPDTTGGTIFISLHFLNNKNKEYELGTSFIEVKDNGDGTFTCQLPNNIANKLRSHSYDIYVSMIYFKGLYKHTFYDGSDISRFENNRNKMLVIEDKNSKLYKSPIPVENMMIFRKTSDRDEFYLEKNTENCQLMAENMYWLQNTDDALDNSEVYNGVKNGIEYKVYYFYYDIANLQYTSLFRECRDLLKIYYPNKSNEEIMTLWLHHDLPNSTVTSSSSGEEQDLIGITHSSIQSVNNTPIGTQFGDLVYYDKMEQMGGKLEYQPFEFKESTLKLWIKHNANILRDYVLEQKKLGSNFYLFTNTLDLSTRIRRDTSTELGSGNLFRFEEDRYVFAFNNSREYPISLDARVFVDGLLVGDVYQERKNFLEYFYIPVSMVTADSFIEIELFPRYTYTKNIHFNNNTDSINIDLPKTDEVIFPTAQDLILAEDTPDGEVRYDVDTLNVICKFDRGEYKYEPTYEPNGDPYINGSEIRYRFTRLKSFTISPNDAGVINKNLSINILKLPMMVRFVADVSGYGFIEIASKDFQLNTEYIRIFRNGRLVSRNKYRLIIGYGYPKILIQQWLEVGDIVYIDITPYRYRLIHSISNIIREDESENIKLSFIDRDIFDKPFDIRYYDVYLNGRKLSINNVFNTSDYCITLVNIKSKYDLEIYERERDYEYFGCPVSGLQYTPGLVDLFELSGYINREQGKKYIHDRVYEQKDPRLNIYPNTFDEERFNKDDNVDLIYAIYFLFYYDELVPKHYYNPDRKQISSKLMTDNFVEVYNRFKISPVIEQSNDVERERRKDYPKVLYLDPDEWVDSSTGVQQRNQQDGQILTWMIGHSEDIVDKDYHVNIPNDTNLI